MKKLASAEVKQRWGEVMDTVQREPVTIEKHGRAVAVLISADEYNAMEQLKLERLRHEIEVGLNSGDPEDFDLPAFHTEMEIEMDAEQKNKKLG